MTEFATVLHRDWDIEVSSYSDLWRWSIDHMDRFWMSFKDWADIIGEGWNTPVMEPLAKLPGVSWFPGARLNFAENLLRFRSDSDAIVFWGEDRVRRTLSFNDLHQHVSVLAQAMRNMGIAPGDRVAAYMPNMPETIIAMLAATAIGATFTSCSPDFGVAGVLDRFGQVEPRLLLSAESYIYGGREHSSLDKLQAIVNGLPSLERVVVVPYLNEKPDLSGIRATQMLADFTSGLSPQRIEFERLPFNHPLYIMYSSGTTGVPKCIVHGAGGTLIQHIKEHRLHCDIREGDRIFYFTTCGWMMWNWLVTGLASGATLLLYDGNPFRNEGRILFDYADAEGMTLFGTSAKFIDALSKAGLEPKNSHDLSTLRLMTSTGSPLVPESFDYVYEAIKTDIQLASIAGGTDIIGCFVLGTPIEPVWRGEIQCAALGMAVAVYDDEGHALTSQKGELVCEKPFPSMPIGFWNDDGDTRYQSAYFDRFPGVWCHGDWIEQTEDGGFIIYGRSDATLNPGGVRIGTAEIYRQVEQLDEILESIVVGQDWKGDVRVVLFCRLREGVEMDAPLIKKIKQHIRHRCTPRHVPAKVLAVADIPRTKSGKITELAVRKMIHGQPVKNREALANPEALDLYIDLPALQS